MSDSFSIISLQRLLKITLNELERGFYFGIPASVFNTTENEALFTEKFGKTLHTPLGVAAGPHTQLAQNIVGAWLCGARYIELKTIQTLDELNVTKPCIDMQDEGYNCEWSQELKINESVEQYLNAWIIIHVLNYRLNGNQNKPAGTIFNMSVGYNMEGILKDNVQWFFNKMSDCSLELAAKINEIRPLVPEIDSIQIPTCISDNITLSTMHGCPPDEIEKIGHYLISEKKLHTLIKLNPTLLGKELLINILNNNLGFKTDVPDLAFEHDLKYEDAKGIIKRLQLAAKEHHVEFGIKLTNTLESLNNKEILPESEKQMYMSGRALHPVSVTLANKIRKDFGQDLSISFSAGADCFNVSSILACNLTPVTVCSDILKPGGYGRLSQYIQEINKILENSGKNNLSDYLTSNPDKNLLEYSKSVIADPYYLKAFKEPDIKTNRDLDYFDCIEAPCVDTCPTHQGIPDYMYYTARGEFSKAFEVILKTNPFPVVTGNVCDHECQSKCTRSNYDSTLAIREVKRFISENYQQLSTSFKPDATNPSATIIGAGPSGLSCAYFLQLSGFKVTVLEQKEFAGGMVSDVIPGFRLSKQNINLDIDRILKAGVEIKYGVRVDKNLFDSLILEKQYVYISTGADSTRSLGLPNDQVDGIVDPLKYLSDLKQNPQITEAKNIVIIGGGNTAMDVARAAKRYSTPDAIVTVVYRRRREDMPAEAEEIFAAEKENIRFIEMANPVEILCKDGLLTGLKLVRMEAAGKFQNKRMITTPITGSEFDIKADLLFPAIGQEVNIEFIDKQFLKTQADGYSTRLENVFIGGDARKGASNIISAIADGRRVASIIMKQSGNQITPTEEFQYTSDINELLLKKTKRVKSQLINQNERIDHQVPVIKSAIEAMEEASRCLLCNKICNVCVSVCPNFANYAYQTQPEKIQLQKAVRQDDGIILENDKIFEIKQEFQIINIADFCNECGNCNTFCPTKSAPYKEKPHFYLTVKSFNDTESGFFISKPGNKTILIQKNKGRFNTLTKTKDEYNYETEEVIAIFDQNSFQLKNVEIRVPCVKTAFFENAATLKVLLEGVQHLYTNDNKY